MRRVLIPVVLISLSVAAPTLEDAQAKILNYENNNDERGTYELSFETSNGIKRLESGRLVNVGQTDEHLEVNGVYSYADPEGNLVIVNYWVDENGYHIGKPVPPYLPPLKPESFFTALPSTAVATLLG